MRRIPDSDRLRRVRDAVARRAEVLLALAADLVAIPTENPPGNAYPRCVELLEARLADFGLPVERVELAPDRVALLSSVGAGSGDAPTLYLHGHYDVVPASAPGQFEPRVEGGRLWGRGSADMKGGVAAMAVAAAVLAELVGSGEAGATARSGLPGRVTLVLVPDEESGGARGTRRLVELGRIRGDAALGAILAEPTSGRIWNAARGAITLRVSMSGRPAHVGLHYEGENAFEAALPILDALRRLKAEVEGRRTAYAVDAEVGRSSILMLGGEVRGAHQFNVVPDRFSFTVERRFNPEEEAAAERERLRAVIRDATPDGARVEIETIQEGASSAAGEGSALVGVLRAVTEAVSGEAPECRLCPGLLETRYYADAGVPAVAYGPGQLEVAHGPEESVSVARLVECAEIYAATALALLTGPGAVVTAAPSPEPSALPETNRTTTTSRRVRAPRESVYRAFVDPDLRAAWLAPGDMTARVHAFDARVGGGYTMSLLYPEDGPGGVGKSGDREDRFSARFAALDPPRRIVEVVTFDAPDPAFAGEMTMIVELEEGDVATDVTLRFDGIPPGIRLEDNEEGSRLSLEKLAALLEPDAAFLARALAQARKSYDEGGLPIGAVMVEDGRVVAEGHNRRVQDGDPVAHGEMSCIRNAGRRASYPGVTLYTTLSPCMMCAGTVVQFGIPRVVVGEDANFAGNVAFLRERGVEVRVLDDPGCRELMGRFIAERPELWNEDIAGEDDTT